MGTTLTGTTPQDTYDSLIKVTDNGPLSGTAKYLSDGLGNDSALALSTSSIGIATTSLPTSFALGSSTTGLSFTSASSSLNSGKIAVLKQVEIGSGNGDLTIETYAGGAGGGERMRITSAGEVLINRSSASGLGKLNVVGGADFTGGNVLMCRDTGSVGIGTSSPSTKFVVSNAGAAGLEFEPTGLIQSYNRGTGIYQTITLDASNVLFRPAGVEIARFTANGLTFNGDTAAANALDDYEEGTWTPNILFGGAAVGVTYGGSNGGTYTKVGRKVSINGYLDISNKGTSTGAAQISNLPFTIAGGAANYGAPSFRPVGISFADMLVGYGDVNDTKIALQECTNAGSVTVLTDSDFSTSTNIIFSFTYFTA